MTEGGPSLIPGTLENSNQIINNYLFKVNIKDNITI